MLEECKCKNCGAPLKEGSFYCEYCGTWYIKDEEPQFHITNDFGTSHSSGTW